MQIFLSCLQSKKHHSVPAYGFWETYFKQGIAEAGYAWREGEEIDWAEGMVYNGDELQVWRERTWSQALIYIKQQHKLKPIDFFLSYLFPKQVEPNAIKEIQALGIPCVNFFCDNVREYIAVPKPFYCFDLHWVPEFKALKMYCQAGLNYIHAPMPAWVPPEQRTCQHPENYGVSFIGSRDVQREHLFARVLQTKTAIEIRGAGWNLEENVGAVASQEKSIWNTLVNQIDTLTRHGVRSPLWKMTYKLQPSISNSLFEPYVRPKPSDLEYGKITQQSIVTLGVNRYPSYVHPFSQPNTYSRLRDLEAPMMGACYLTEWTEGLDLLYDLGEEIETYRTPEEMAEKIEQLIDNPEKRMKMRYLGQKRALSEHTIAKSLTKVTRALGLS